MDHNFGLNLHKQNFSEVIQNLKTIPSVSDNIDFTKFIFPHDSSGLCMYHIPYNLFGIFKDQAVQKVYQELLKEYKDSGKKFCKLIEDKLEKS